MGKGSFQLPMPCGFSSPKAIALQPGITRQMKDAIRAIAFLLRRVMNALAFIQLTKAGSAYSNSTFLLYPPSSRIHNRFLPFHFQAATGIFIKWNMEVI